MKTSDMSVPELLEFIEEHSDLSDDDVWTIWNLTDSEVLANIVREIRRGWSVSIEDMDDDVIDGIQIRLEKNGQSKILD